MFSRFRSAIYGSSGTSDDSSVITRGEHRESALGNRMRSALTRSSSLREDLSNGISRNGDKMRAPEDRIKDSSYDASQYSQHSLRRNNIGSLNDGTNQINNKAKQSKYFYRRPEFLQLRTEDEISVTADHQIRPIILPRDASRLPWHSGYAECINAGKSLRNEDQATCYQGVAMPLIDTTDENFVNQLPMPIYKTIPWTYFAVFDGHAGSAVATAAANQLHHILAEKLDMVASTLVTKLIEAERSHIVDACVDKSITQKIETMNNPCKSLDEASLEDDISNDNQTINDKEAECDTVDTGVQENSRLAASNEETKISIKSESKPSQCDYLIYDNLDLSADQLIKGALESAFWEMDAQIGADKRQYKMPGGCTAIVALFILGKLYVCNAGDSRAIKVQGNESSPLSHDFTPISERERLNRLGLQSPELLCDTFTQIEYYPQHPSKSQLGTKMFYKDAYMTGYASKTITKDDLRYPLVCGEGKRSRLLATIGVTRGFGDHEMRSQYGSVPIKPFLTPEPEITCMDLEDRSYDFTADDVLIIGTDGLWDVTSLEGVQKIIKNSFEMFPDIEESRSKYRYMTAAQDLIIQARGQLKNRSLWLLPDSPYGPQRIASHDDISVFVIPFKPFKQEYEEWKEARLEAYHQALTSAPCVKIPTTITTNR